jgi:hypothetical protein
MSTRWPVQMFQMSFPIPSAASSRLKIVNESAADVLQHLNKIALSPKDQLATQETTLAGLGHSFGARVGGKPQSKSGQMSRVGNEQKEPMAVAAMSSMSSGSSRSRRWRCSASGQGRRQRSSKDWRSPSLSRPHFRPLFDEDVLNRAKMGKIAPRRCGGSTVGMGQESSSGS